MLVGAILPDATGFSPATALGLSPPAAVLNHFREKTLLARRLVIRRMACLADKAENQVRQGRRYVEHDDDRFPGNLER